MSNQFEPYYKNTQQTNEFNVWEYKPPVEDVNEEPVIDEKEVFLAECEKLREEAKKQGFAEGLALAQHEIEAQKKELIRWLAIVQEPVKLLDDHLTQDILQTLLYLSEHCIGVELSIHPEKLISLLNTIKNELSSMKEYHQFVMHPEDVAWLKKELDASVLPGFHDLLVADSSLKRGDFYLQSEQGELDGRIHTRFATLLAKYLQDNPLLSSPLS